MLIDAYLKLQTLEEMVKVLKTRNMKGVAVIISVNDKPNEYGQNVTGWVKQTKEDRESKRPRYYVLNGKTLTQPTQNDSSTIDDQDINITPF